MDLALKTAAGAVVLYVFYAIFLFCLQRQILFPKHLVTPPSPAKLPPETEKITLSLPFGSVEAWYMETKKAALPAPAAIFAHGNGELIDFWPEMLRPLNRMGMSILLVEYPGYGRSDGEPSHETITQTLTAARENLLAKKAVDPSRIIYIGRSMGGGAICSLARQFPPKALVLMSTFTSVKSFAARYMMPTFLVRDPFDNLTFVESFPGPVLLVHGRNDEVIPFSHAQKLYRAAQNAHLIPYDSGHNDCPPDWKVFWKDLSGFLIKSGIPVKPPF